MLGPALAALSQHWGYALAAVVTFFLVNGFVAWASARRAARVDALLAALRALPGSGRTPVTLVTGFLGAGKTTLLNGLLARPPPGVRLAVLENERGAIALDHELLAGSRSASAAGAAGAPPLRILLLANGCMCCSSPETAGRGDLERSLEALLALGDRPSAQAAAPAAGGGAGLDHIVIETSGLADPAPLVHALLALGARSDARFFLAGVVAVCDAAHLAYHADAAGVLSRATEAGQQLAFADLVLMNKADAASPPALAAALAAASRVNPTARVLPCVRAAVDAAVVLDCRALDPARALAALGGAAALSRPAPPARHAPGVGTLFLGPLPPPGSAALPLERNLLPWLQRLHAQHAASLYRVKGLVTCAESSGGTALFLQGVHGSLQVARVPMASLRGSSSGGEAALGIVIIGLRLPEAEIARSFEECVWQQPAAPPSSRRDGAHES